MRRAGTDAVRRRLAQGLDQTRIAGQAEVVVAGEIDQLAAIDPHPRTVAALPRVQRALRHLCRQLLRRIAPAFVPTGHCDQPSRCKFHPAPWPPTDPYARSPAPASPD